MRTGTSSDFGILIKHLIAFQHVAILVAINQILIAFLSLEHSEVINSKLSIFFPAKSNRNVYFMPKSSSCTKQFFDKTFTMLHSSSLDCLLDVEIDKIITRVVGRRG